MAGNIADLFELDPDLVAAVPPSALADARRTLQVRLVVVPRGRWPAGEIDLGERPMGILVAEGLVLRRVLLEHRAAAEILGGGDLLRPWERSCAPFRDDWRVLETATLALLDRHAAARIARYPGVLLTLLDRELARSRRMGERCAIAQLGSTEDRLLIELRSLAYRWGRQRADGIALQLPLTHEVLGHLVGTRRPAVTSALSRMTRAGTITPLPGCGWLLATPPDDATAVA